MSDIKKLKRIHARCALNIAQVCEADLDHRDDVAAWRSTVTEIKALLPILALVKVPEYLKPLVAYALSRKTDILAAWPEELL